MKEILDSVEISRPRRNFSTQNEFLDLKRRFLNTEEISRYRRSFINLKKFLDSEENFCPDKIFV